MLRGGGSTLTPHDGACALHGRYRWTCRSPTGCRLEDGVVMEGTIVETTA